MNLTKEQWQKVIGAVIVFIIAVLSALGYDVAFVQPRIAALQSGAPASGPAPALAPTAVLGQYYESVIVGKDFKSLGTATLKQATITSATITTATISTVISSTNALTTTALTVSGPTVLDGGLTMDTNKFIVADTTGNTEIAGSLVVTGTSTLIGAATTTGALGVGQNLTITGATLADGSLTAVGASALNGGLKMDTNKFIVADTTGNTEIAGSLVVTGPSTLIGAATTTGALGVGQNLTVTGALGVSGVATFSGFNVASSASITPTNGGTLTPSAFLVTLTPAGNVGTALAACTSGQQTILYNSVNASVVITDTGNGVLAGDQTLGQYDTLQLACFGSKWVQVGAVSAN